MLQNKTLEFYNKNAEAFAEDTIDVGFMEIQDKFLRLLPYDGIWACASILHLPKREQGAVLRKMVAALKSDGVTYTSFKYGEFEGERNGRFFTDFIAETFTDCIRSIERLQVEEYWITDDVRPGRGEEKWLNLILRKPDIH